MNLERFKQMIDTYGGNPYRWPANERLAAEKFLENSLTAQQWQQEALHLDHLLDSITEIIPPVGLKAKILAEVQTLSREIDLWQWLAQWLWGTTLTQHLWRPAIALGLPIILGIGLGLATSSQHTQLIESAMVTHSELTNILYPEQENLAEWEKWL